MKIGEGTDYVVDAVPASPAELAAADPGD